MVYLVFEFTFPYPYLDLKCLNFHHRFHNCAQVGDSASPLTNSPPTTLVSAPADEAGDRHPAPEEPFHQVDL